MRWIRRHKAQSAAATAIAVGALVMAFALSSLLFGGTDASAGPDSPLADTTADAPSYIGPDVLPLSDDPSQAPAPVTGNPGLPALGSGGPPTLTGLKGKGGVINTPEHRIVLRLTSAAPIAYVGYNIPSSLTDGTGTVKNLGTSWSLTTIGYGPPDYAQMFSIASPGGVPVTCTITIDGKVTEQRTTKGPYDQLFCQG